MSKKHKKITRKDKVAQSGEPDKLVKSIAGGAQWTPIPPIVQNVGKKEIPHSYHKETVVEIKKTCKFAVALRIYEERANRLLAIIDGLPDDQEVEYVVFKERIYTMDEWTRVCNLKAFL